MPEPHRLPDIHRSANVGVNSHILHRLLQLKYPAGTMPPALTRGFLNQERAGWHKDERVFKCGLEQMQALMQLS
jgi:hypothetical protein